MEIFLNKPYAAILAKFSRMEIEEENLSTIERFTNLF